MANNIEWHSASERPHGYTPTELAELSHDGENEEGYIGLGSGDTMLYGSMTDIIGWLKHATTEVERLYDVQMEARKAEVGRTIREGLSRDDETEFGSEFEGRVETIRNLNTDSLPDAHDGKPDKPNADYRRGQIDMLMDVTAWAGDRPEPEDVYLYIFGEDMP